MSKDLYKILGVDRGASKDEIKKAYRKKSKELHPDKHKGDKEVEKKFQEVNQAYEVLNDEKKRQAYDQFGSTDGDAGFGGGQGFGGFDFSGFQQADGGGFSDIFESFFGGGAGGGRRSNDAGRDMEIELTIEFADVINGAKKTISLTRLRACDACNGDGAEPGSTTNTCSECNGTGQVVRTAQSFLGTVQQTLVCNTCKGSGKVPEKPCNKCNAEGRISVTEDVTIDIPAGIHEGQTLRVQGEGEAGRLGAQSGNLYVHIRIRQDKRFERDGDDIRSTAAISVIDALLGTELKVETVYGPTTLKVPEGTQPGQVMRLKDKGLPLLNTSRKGDHYITITVEIPKKLSKKERKLIEEWKNL